MKIMTNITVLSAHNRMLIVKNFISQHENFFSRDSTSTRLTLAHLQRWCLLLLKQLVPRHAM